VYIPIQSLYCLRSHTVLFYCLHPNTVVLLLHSHTVIVRFTSPYICFTFCIYKQLFYCLHSNTVVWLFTSLYSRYTVYIPMHPLLVILITSPYCYFYCFRPNTVIFLFTSPYSRDTVYTPLQLFYCLRPNTVVVLFTSTITTFYCLHPHTVCTCIIIMTYLVMTTVLRGELHLQII
jgi:hypothetical protein